MRGDLRKRIAQSPTSPGVYRWLDKKGDVLYIGKAKSLRNRLKSYLQKEKKQSPWKDMLCRQIAAFDFTVTSNELEALILETNLIKEVRPKYNVLMKDDKNYVYVKVTVQERFPRVEIVRRMEEERAKYFGPYLQAWQTERTLQMLHEVFGYRACRRSVETLNKDSKTPRFQDSKPCLDFHIGRCNGLCVGNVTKEEYRSRIEEVLKFFGGNHEIVKNRLKEMMQSAAGQMRFERAAKLRDTLGYIHSLEQQQVVSGTTGDNTDVIGVSILNGKAHVVVLRERGGKVISEIPFSLTGQPETVAAVLSQFLPQYYLGVPVVPETIVIGEEIEDQALLEDWLREKRGKKVAIVIPSRGKKQKLLTMANRNASEKLKAQLASFEAEATNVKSTLEQLREALKLPSELKRIECYDISHLGGTETVGSMVVFINGKPKKDHYRHFTLRTVRNGEIDDYKALREVLRRRLRYLTDKTAEWLKQIHIALEKEGKLYVSVTHDLEDTYAMRGFRYVRTVPRELKGKVDDGSIVMMLERKKEPDVSLTSMPDLILLDGGKGQLHIGLQVLKEAGLEIPCAALAKEKEEVFFPPDTEAIPLPEAARFILERARDEAHRFANSHREKRLKRVMFN
jgi:excinuclease ABC subunit C